MGIRRLTNRVRSSYIVRSVFVKYYLYSILNSKFKIISNRTMYDKRTRLTDQSQSPQREFEKDHIPFELDFKLVSSFITQRALINKANKLNGLT